jgi:PmbA protein
MAALNYSETLEQAIMNANRLPTQESSNKLPSLDTLKQVVRQALDEAQRAGASAAEAGVSADVGLSVTVRVGEVETLEYHRDRGLGVTVYFGHKKGSASSADFRPEALAATVRAACDIARYTAADPYAGLPDPALLATPVQIPDLQLYHPWDLAAEQAITLAQRAEQAGRDVDARITNSDGASVSSHQGLRVYGNSHGFLQGYPSTRHSVSCVLLSEDAQGNMQRDYWHTLAREASALESPEDVGRKAAERALRRLGAHKLKTCEVPVLFVPEMARSLIGHLLAAIRGGAQYRKASFLLGAQGKAIMPSFMQMHEDPHIIQGLASAPFDNEGVRTASRNLIEQGVLQGYILDSYAARKLSTQTTGNAGGVHNLTVATSRASFDDLVRQMDRGLVVTELMGQGANTVTGDYSRGAAGFWVEKGVIQYPVEEITIAGRLQDMFMHILAVGADVDYRSGVRTGSILLERMTVAGE